MLNFTIVWVLRFAPLRFLGGLCMSVMSVYMIFNTPNAASSESQPFVAAPFVFGSVPYFVTLVAGAVLVFFAWRCGKKWRFGG